MFWSSDLHQAKFKKCVGFFVSFFDPHYLTNTMSTLKASQCFSVARVMCLTKQYASGQPAAINTAVCNLYSCLHSLHTSLCVTFPLFYAGNRSHSKSGDLCSALYLNASCGDTLTDIATEFSDYCLFYETIRLIIFL